MRIRQRVLALSLTAFVAGGLAATGSAQVVNLTGSSTETARVPIPEFVFGDIPASTVISTVTITQADIDAIGADRLITGVNFTIEGLTHSHLSDLAVTVAHLDSNRSATLFNRVGIVDNPSDPNNPGNGDGVINSRNADGLGSNANFSGSYRFRDGGDDLFDVAAATADGDAVPVLNVGPGATFLPVYAPSGANRGAVGLSNLFGELNGDSTIQSTLGTWQFSFSDRSDQTDPADTLVPFDNGIQNTQSFTRTNVLFNTAAAAIPEPGTVSGLMFAVLAISARRRRV